MTTLTDHSSQQGAGWRVGVDIGGTFTDVILLGPDGQVGTMKVLSTPPDFEHGVLSALQAACSEAGIEPSAVDTLLHGTTVATNAILEAEGARTALITTRGFRDVLELGRLRRPTLYDLQWVKPVPLAARHLRVELDHRIAADGSVLEKVRPDQVRELVRALLANGAESIAVCLLNSYVNPEEERRIANLVRECAPNTYVTASVDVSPEMYEFERTSTAVVNSYVGPIVSRYVSKLLTMLRGLDVKANLLIMQSTGGLLEAEVVASKPVQIIESGPAAGVIAVQNLARSLGLENVVAFDMGGTTAKASLLEGGNPFIAADYEVGAGMNVSRGLGKGAGYAVRFPSIDIAEVGAGGGSVVHVDSAGALHVGPQSAQANPGPACYGLGGTNPTLTDANVVLGFLSPDGLAGGRVPISRDLGAKVLSEVGIEIGMDAASIASGAYQVAVSNMTQAVKAVTSERGRDPRKSVLVAFGGAGPLYGAYLAKALGIRKIIVPRFPGLFSSVGLMTAHTERHMVTPYTQDLRNLSSLEAEISSMECSLIAELQAHHPQSRNVEIARYLDMRYHGQRFELRIAMPDGLVNDQALAVCRQRFHAEHARTYGRSGSDDLVEVVNVRVVGRFRNQVQIDAVLGSRIAGSDEPAATRICRFEDADVETPVLVRAQVSSELADGPAVIEDMDSTVLVPPGARFHRDAMANIVIEWIPEGV